MINTKDVISRFGSLIDGHELSYRKSLAVGENLSYLWDKAPIAVSRKTAVSVHFTEGTSLCIPHMCISSLNRERGCTQKQHVFLKMNIAPSVRVLFRQSSRGDVGCHLKPCSLSLMLFSLFSHLLLSQSSHRFPGGVR